VDGLPSRRSPADWGSLDTITPVGRVLNENDGNAVLDGGPLDGREHRVEPDTAELLVVMEDGSRHLYVACDRVQALSDGRVVPVFEHRGRDYPLRSSGT
jgi:hypothetical protein